MSITPETATPDTEALDAWFADNVPGRHGRLALERFAGGQSNPTYRLDTPTGHDGQAYRPLLERKYHLSG